LARELSPRLLQPKSQNGSVGSRITELLRRLVGELSPFYEESSLTQLLIDGCD
jgi:hypothetical protein